MSTSFVSCERLIAFVVLLTLQACSGINTRSSDGKAVRLSREQFAAYVEETFRYHNRVVNDLIMTSSLGDPDFEFDNSLVHAEEQMAAKCAPLNDIVSATIEGRELSLWSKLRLPDQVPACAQASRKVDALLEAL